MEHRINEFITAPVVRVVGENIESKVVGLREALQLAEEQELDLVEISPKANPPVCKIMDYQKFLYQKKKKEKENKSNTTKVLVKEIRFGPNTDEHDYQFKLKHAINFLQENCKVKATIFFKGRTIMYQQKGEILLLQLAQDLEEYAKVESLPKLEGKRMTLLLSPKTTKKTK